MAETKASLSTLVRVICEQRLLPPYDRMHGTPDPVLWRRVSLQAPEGSAAFEQTDYGHPGRLNDWEPRDVAPGLQPRLAELRGVAEALGRLLE